jgi:hypothetical protein
MHESATAQTMFLPSAANALRAASALTVLTDLIVSRSTGKSGQT